MTDKHLADPVQRFMTITNEPKYTTELFEDPNEPGPVKARLVNRESGGD